MKSIVYSIKSTPLPETEISSYKVIESIHFQIYIAPGIYELEEIYEYKQQCIKRELVSLSTPIKFTVEGNTRTMKSIMKSSNPFYFNSDLNLLFGFIEKEYTPGIYKTVIKYTFII